MSANAQLARGFVAFCLAVAFMLAAASAPARADAAAEKYIRTAADEATGILNSTTMSKDAKKVGLTKMIDTRLDLDAIAKFTLGKYARVATDAEKAEFIPLLKQYVINFYVNNLVNYTDVSFKVTGSQDRPNNQGSIVSSKLSAGRDEPTDAIWWVRSTQAGMRIFDVQLQGIWVAQSLRSELDSVMGNQGGKVSAGIADLRAKVSSAPQPQP